MTVQVQFECEWDEPLFSSPQTVICRAEIEPAGAAADATPPGRPAEPASVQHIEAFTRNSLGHRMRIDPIPSGLYRDLEEAALTRYEQELENKIADAADRKHKEDKDG